MSQTCMISYTQYVCNTTTTCLITVQSKPTYETTAISGGNIVNSLSPTSQHYPKAGDRSWHSSKVGHHKILPMAIFFKHYHIVSLRETTALGIWSVWHETPVYGMCMLYIRPATQWQIPDGSVGVQQLGIRHIVCLADRGVHNKVPEAHALEIIAHKGAFRCGTFPFLMHPANRCQICNGKLTKRHGDTPLKVKQRT